MTEQSDRLKAATKAIRDNFDRGAGGYAGFEEESSFFATLLGELLTLCALPVGGRVLDVGCGTGASLGGLAAAVGPDGAVMGIDISEGMLKKARERLGPTFQLACIDGCDYGDAVTPGFDAVVYNAVLFLLPDAEGSLLSALKVLRPGGVLLVSNLERLTLDGVLVPDILREEGHRAGRHTLSPWEKVEGLVRRYFTGVKLKPLELPMSPQLFAGFYGLEPMSAGLLPRLAYAERRAIVVELANRWQEEGRAPLQRWMLLAAKKPEE